MCDYLESISSPGEEWSRFRDSHYLVSTHGRVFTTVKRRLVRSVTERTGYVRIHVTGHGTHFAHRLVAEVWIPNPQNKPWVNHIDGDKSNNHVSNLEWITPSENNMHAVRIGLMPSGPEHHNSVLTADEVAKIRESYATGHVTMTHLSQVYGVGRGTIKRALHGMPTNHEAARMAKSDGARSYWAETSNARSAIRAVRHSMTRRSRLADEQVRSIRTALADGNRPTAVADDHGVSVYTVMRIRDGKTYRAVI